MSLSRRPRILLLGGGGGFLGRPTLEELRPAFAVRSVHRTRAPGEGPDVEWVPADLERVDDAASLVRDVDTVLNLAWYRWASPARFRRLYEGLRRVLEAARAAGVRRFVHVSVPDAPEELESGLPYLVYKRRFDRDLAASGLGYRIVRPTMLFGPGDRLLGVMLRLMHRYPVFPMFGSGEYHVSPIAVGDVARILRQEAAADTVGTVTAGGPASYRYRDLTDLMFRTLGKRPRYWHLSPRASVAFGRLVQSVGSSRLYAYEVTWLLSDRLGPPPYPSGDRRLERVEPYLWAQAALLRGAAGAAPAPRG